MPRRLLLPFAVLCLLFATLTANGQTYSFKRHTSSSGLPNNQVFCVFQDRRGFIWFGTNAGICRYDGAEYATFNRNQGLKNDSTRAIFEDASGALWALTRGGAGRLDGEKFTFYTKADGLPGDDARAGIGARDGSVWIGTTDGLCRYVNGTFKTFTDTDGLPKGQVWALLESRSGAIWVGLRGGGLARYADGKFQTFGKAEGLMSPDIFYLAEDEKGSLWIATDGGLFRFDGGTFRKYGLENGLPSLQVSTVVAGKSGTIWCGTFGGGLCRLEGDRFIVFNRKNGLPDEYVTALAEDYEGNIWLGSIWGGAARFSSELFAAYTEASGIGQGVVTDVAAGADGAIWISTANGGLSRIAPDGAIRRFGIKDGLLDESLWAVFVDREGRVWTGGLKGVSCFQNDRFKNYTLEEMGSRTRISSIGQDGAGRIWFASDTVASTGVYAWDGNTFTRFTTDQGLPSHQTSGFETDPTGVFWVSTERGLCRLDGDRFTPVGQDRGLPPGVVRCTHHDSRGRFWVGMTEGLFLEENGRFHVFRKSDGLADDNIRSLSSLDNTLWIGSPKGITSFDGTNFRRYTTGDGLLSADIVPNSSVRTSGGMIWFGTPDGVVRCRPSARTLAPTEPRLVLEQIRTPQRVLAADRAIDIPAGENTLTFSFVALSFTDEQSVLYSYRLDGLDAASSQWSPPSRERTARFTNLPARQFTFSVRAVGSAGKWSAPQTVTLNIRPPFWQTKQFIGLISLALVALVLGGYFGRIRVLERRHQERLAGLRRLLESSRVINSQLDLDATLRNIATEAADLLDAEPAAIGLIENNRIVFRQRWINGKWDSTPLMLSLQKRRNLGPDADPELTEDGSFEHYLAVALADARTRGSADLMEVPIRSRAGTVVGMMLVRRTAGKPPFTDEDRQAGEAFATQAAVAIENASFYVELEQKNAEIATTLREIERLYSVEQGVTRRLQELDRMKTNFMMVTSHEMRTPLTVLQGYSDALLDGYLDPLTDRQRNSVLACKRMVERLSTSFEDIVATIHMDEGRLAFKPTTFDLAEAVREVVGELQPFIEQRKLRVTFEADGPVNIKADPEKTRLVFTNTVQNAIKFTPDGGEIRIRIQRENGTIHAAIEDTGIGLEAGELERVFERFYTGGDPLKHTSGRFEFTARGVGLGLFIAKSYVEAQGGKMWAESDGPGKGSRFHVTLPA